jgi:hypothetical protein
MRLALVLTALLISACGSIPSFYDDNESLLAVKVRHQVSQLDCSAPDKAQILELKKQVDILALYSDSKKSNDIGELIALMQETSNGLYNKESFSTPYCNLKKKALELQSKDIASAIMKRF